MADTKTGSAPPSESSLKETAATVEKQKNTSHEKTPISPAKPKSTTPPKNKSDSKGSPPSHSTGLGPKGPSPKKNPWNKTTSPGEEGKRAKNSSKDGGVGKDVPPSSGKGIKIPKEVSLLVKVSFKPI